MIDDLLITTSTQRENIKRYVSKMLNIHNNPYAALALGECMNEIEFDLKEIRHIKKWRENNPTGTFEDFYKDLHTLVKTKKEYMIRVQEKETSTWIVLSKIYSDYESAKAARNLAQVQGPIFGKYEIIEYKVLDD